MTVDIDVAKFEARCSCGRPYVYAKTYGCRPDWCAVAPAPITNALWAEFNKRLNDLETLVKSEHTQKISRLEREIF